MTDSEHTGRERIRHVYELADVYHCENIDKVSDELIEKSVLSPGTFNNGGLPLYGSNLEGEMLKE